MERLIESNKLKEQRKMKKTMRQHSVASRLKSLALAFGITLAFASCANEEIAQNQNGKDYDANLTTFSTGDPTPVHLWKVTVNSFGKQVIRFT